MQAREPMQFCYYDIAQQQTQPITDETTIYVVKNIMSDADSAPVVSFSLRGCLTTDLAKLGKDPLSRQTTYWVLENPTDYSRLFEGDEEGTQFTLRSTPLSVDEFSSILQLTPQQLLQQFSPETAQLFSAAVRRENHRVGVQALHETAMTATTVAAPPARPPMSAERLMAPRVALPENPAYLERYQRDFTRLLDFFADLSDATPEDGPRFIMYQSIQLDMEQLITAIRNIEAQMARPQPEAPPQEEEATAPRMGMR